MSTSDELEVACPRYMVISTPCRADFWATLEPAEAATMRNHYEYLAAMQERGELEFAGRDKGEKFGVLILRMSSQDAVRRAFDASPAAVGSLMSFEITPFNLSLDRDAD